MPAIAAITGTSGADMPKHHSAILATLILGLAVPAAAGVKEGVEKWQAGDHKAAVIEWLPFAAKGDPDALFNLGQAYKLGRGVPVDLAKAEDFYRRAAAKGHAPAQTNLGIVLAQRGDKVAAAELWQKAAEKRDARAQYMLGILYFNGDTLAKDWPRAYAYMLAANNAGLPQASRALDTMNANIPKADRDRGSQIAEAFFAGDRLANSGRPIERPRDVAPATPAAKAAPKPAVPAAVAASPVSRSLPARPVDRPQPAVVKSVVTPPPARVASVDPAAAGSPPGAAARAAQWRVQVGAFSRRARAEEAWQEIRQASAGLLKSAAPHYEEAGNVVRLQIGAYDRAAEATALCDSLKQAGHSCFIVSN